MRFWLDRFATRILGVSEASLRGAWGQNWRSDARCEVIYNGIDASLYALPADPIGVRREFGIPLGSALCIHVGRIDSAKNHTRLLRIFKCVLRLRQDSYLILVGGGDSGLDQNTRADAAQLGLGERVVFAGTRGDVPRLLRASDLMIFPSLREGLPGAILEASAAGTPVLASDLPCIVEIAERLKPVRCLPLSQPNEIWAETAISMIAQHGATETGERFDLTQFAIGPCARAFELIYGDSGRRLEARHS
jgi:glycosyltransferase involved in cell wall biosynthesis